MDPLTMAGIAGGGSLLGSYLQNQMSERAADKMMNFQRDMRETAHQVEVEDLRRAGLNPMLSALGSGAPSPGGAQATFSNMGEGISKGMDTAIAIRQQNKDLDAKDAGIDNLHAETQNKKVQNALIQNQTSASAKDVEAKTLQNRLLRETIDSQIKKARAEGDYSEINQLMGIINAGASSAASLVSPIKLLPRKK